MAGLLSDSCDALERRPSISPEAEAAWFLQKSVTHSGFAVVDILHEAGPDPVHEPTHPSPCTPHPSATPEPLRSPTSMNPRKRQRATGQDRCQRSATFGAKHPAFAVALNRYKFASRNLEPPDLHPETWNPRTPEPEALNPPPLTLNRQLSTQKSRPRPQDPGLCSASPKPLTNFYSRSASTQPSTPSPKASTPRPTPDPDISHAPIQAAQDCSVNGSREPRQAGSSHRPRFPIRLPPPHSCLANPTTRHRRPWGALLRLRIGPGGGREQEWRRGVGGAGASGDAQECALYPPHPRASCNACTPPARFQNQARRSLAGSWWVRERVRGSE